MGGNDYRCEFKKAKEDGLIQGLFYENGYGRRVHNFHVTVNNQPTPILITTKDSGSGGESSAGDWRATYGYGFAFVSKGDIVPCGVTFTPRKK